MQSNNINKIHFGDLIYLQLDNKNLFYSPSLRSPVLVSSLKDFSSPFRSAIFQILPVSLNPLESTNSISQSNP